MRRKLKERNSAGFVTYFVLVIASILILFPIMWMLSTSFKRVEDTFIMPPTLLPHPVSIEAYIMIWKNYPFFYFFKNSLIVVFSSTLISMCFSCLAGYGASRYRFVGRGAFLTFLLTTQMFPSIMLLVPFYKVMITYGLTNTHMGLILPYVSFTIPFCTWMMMGYFDTLPKSLDESASIDGCNAFQTFVRIILPLALPGLIATGIYSFIQGWNEYMFALTLTSAEKMKTVPVGIGQMTGENRTMYNDMMAASAVAGIPVTIVFLVLQKYLIGNLAAGAVKQ